MKIFYRSKQVYFYILLCIFFLIITTPVILPFFYKGYFPTHDGEWAVIRLTDMYRELKDKQIPPRFSGNLNFGYGYPLFNFTYPFPYYAGIVIYLLHFGFVNSIKILFISSVLFSAVSMFFVSKTLWNSTLAGFISSTAYVYVPYRMVDLFVRGSLGESLSFALFPAILFCVIKLLRTGKDIYGIFLAILYGILVQTHNIMAIFFSIFLLLFILGSLFYIRYKSIKKIVFFLLLGVGASAFFWLPALVEKKHILLSYVPIADRSLYFVTFPQLFFSKWGYGAPASSDGFTYQIGIPFVLILLITLIVLISKKRSTIFNTVNTQALVLVGITILFFPLLFKESEIVWRLPFLSEINYPWILLGMLGFLLSLLSGFVAAKPFWRFVAVCCVLVNIFLVLPHAKPQYFVDRGDTYYMTNDATTTSSNELMPIWVKKFPLRRPENKAVLIKGRGLVETEKLSSRRITFTANLQTDGVVRINTIYYPGWILEGSKRSIAYDNPQGVMEIPLSKGMNKISLVFKETLFRSVCDLLSLFSLFIIAVLFVKQIKVLKVN